MEKEEAKETLLLTFLDRTKKGEYAPIEKTSLKYARLKTERIVVEDEKIYYYGIS
jgi:hypothetical protein